MPGSASVIERRLQRNPKNVAALRSQQDFASEEKREAVLTRHRELASQHAADPDWHYIGIRAMPDGLQQDDAFVAASERWPNHVWLANASGFVLAGRGEWQTAEAAFKTAHRRNSPVSGSAALTLARIRRYVARGPADLKDLSGQIEVGSMLALEKGGLQDPASNAFFLIHSGQLEQAHNLIQAEDDHLKVLLAASEGATPQWQQTALQAPIETLEHPPTLLYLTALAFRRGEPHEKYLERFSTVTQDLYKGRRKTAFEFVKSVLKDGPKPELESLLDGRMPVERGYGLAAAIIMFPDQVPSEWRRAARAFLFAPERPYFAE